jgi:hypothetical protein
VAGMRIMFLVYLLGIAAGLAYMFVVAIRHV